MPKDRRWTKLSDLPQTMTLDGLRIRYKGRVLGYIKSGWGRGLWLTPKPDGSNVAPWFPPEGMMLLAAPHMEVEV